MEKSRRIIAIAALGVLLSGAVTASFLGAFHSPAPHRVPVGFVGPPATKTRVLSSLGAGPPGAFDVRAYPTARAVETAVEHQRLDGALVVPPRGAVTVVIASAAGSAPTGLVSTVLGQAASSLGRPVTTRDVAPLAPADREGLSVFFLVLAILLPSLLVGVGTSLAASSVAPSVQAAALVATAATLGFGAAAIAGPGLGAVDGHFLGIGLEAALVCLAIAMSSALLARLAPVGGVVSLVLFVVIGVPAAGGPAGLERFVPAFFRDLAPYLPTSGAVSILRSTTYFHGLGMWPDAWVLVAWAGAGLLGLTALGRRGPSEGLHRTQDHRRGHRSDVMRGDAHSDQPADGCPSSRWTVSGEKAGKQTETYRAPPSEGVEYRTREPAGQWTAWPAVTVTRPSSVSTTTSPSSTTVYSSNSGRWYGSDQPLGLSITATETSASPVLILPMNSEISLGGCPWAASTWGAEMSFTMPTSFAAPLMSHPTTQPCHTGMELNGEGGSR